MNCHAAYTQPCFLQGAIKLETSFFIAKNNTNVMNELMLSNCSSEFTQGGCKIISTLRAYEATC